MSDLPEITAGGDGSVEFAKGARDGGWVVRSALSKTGRQYITYLPEQGCGYVKQYPEWRMRIHERGGLRPS